MSFKDNIVLISVSIYPMDVHQIYRAIDEVNKNLKQRLKSLEDKVADVVAKAETEVKPSIVEVPSPAPAPVPVSTFPFETKYDELLLKYVKLQNENTELRSEMESQFQKLKSDLEAHRKQLQADAETYHHKIQSDFEIEFQKLRHELAIAQKNGEIALRADLEPSLEKFRSDLAHYEKEWVNLDTRVFEQFKKAMNSEEFRSLIKTIMSFYGL